MQGQEQVGGEGSGRQCQAQVLEGCGGFLLAYEQSTALLSRFDTVKAYAHDTAAHMFLLLGIPPKLISFSISFSFSGRTEVIDASL